jgi:hypothetical protein
MKNRIKIGQSRKTELNASCLILIEKTGPMVTLVHVQFVLILCLYFSEPT